MSLPYCNHPVYREGHCAEMMCGNYVSKCPKHGFNGSDHKYCNHESMTEESVPNRKGRRK